MCKRKLSKKWVITHLTGDLGPADVDLSDGRKQCERLSHTAQRTVLSR